MTRGIRSFPLLAAALLLVAGCAAHTLSSLQTQFKELQTTRAACDKAQTMSELCLTSADAPLLDLAQQTRKAAEQADDPRTRIGYLALAAIAGWESHTETGLQLADDVAGEGQERCSALDPKTFGAPRDCALLRLAPAFARHVRAVNFLVSLQNAPTPLPPDLQNALRAQSQTYIANTWDVMEAVRRDLERNREVSPSVKTYLEHQRVYIYCTAVELARWDQETGDTALHDTMMADVDAKMMAAFDNQLPSGSCRPGMFTPM